MRRSITLGLSRDTASQGILQSIVPGHACETARLWLAALVPMDCQPVKGLSDGPEKSVLAFNVLEGIERLRGNGRPSWMRILPRSWSRLTQKIVASALMSIWPAVADGSGPAIGGTVLRDPLTPLT